MKKINKIETSKNRNIPKNWIILKVEEFAEVTNGGTPSTKDSENFGGDIPWITPKDLSNYLYRYIEKGERNITRKGLNNSSAKLLPKDTVLLTTRAPVGYVAIVANTVTTNQGMKGLIPKKNILSEFLYYLLKSNTKYLKANSSGTTFGELNTEVLKSLKFLIPPLDEQYKISDLLVKIDKKIELNHQMNEILEKIAQAIFKSWFIDFEPFQDGEFVESEMGRIPINWKIYKFTDKFLVGGGGTPKTKIEDYWNGNIFWATGKDISQNKGIFLMSSERKITELGLSRSSAKLYPKNATVITARGTVGELKILSKDIAISQTCYALLPKNENHHYYLYLLTSNMIDTLKRRAYGAIFDTITTRIFESYDIFYPPEKTLNRFDEIVIPIYDKILLNQKEIEKLNVLRDLLLPQLISGRLRITNPEKFLEEIKN